ncbi:MAG TPA: tetratricopeptide repeat protein [Bryobacteraceae bacterium]|nr:tetratricopeptide repeat protein [Bryobacteraceae bacterium]
MRRTTSVLATFAVSTLLSCVRAADDAALRDAAAAIQRGDYTAAESKLRVELEIHPADPDALSLLGMVLDARKQFVEADALYKKAIGTAPRSIPVLGRYANHLLAAGDESGAYDAFQRVVAIAPADPYANLALARLELKNKDAAHAKAALVFLDRLPAGLRDTPEAAVPRLIALSRSGDTPAAGALVTQLANATQSDPKLSSSIGWTLARAGQFAQAEPFLTQALAGNPSDFQLLYDLGVVALYAQHYDRAREVLEKAVHRQPQNADALYSLAFVYSSLKQPESALRFLAEAAKAAPKRADVQRLIAVTTGELQANEDSAAAWDRYAALAPEDDTARRERGFARIHMRQFDTGIADLDWYIARHPKDPVGYYELGLAQSMNDPTKGLSSLDTALELKPDFVEARSARGALYYLQGRPEVAVPDLESAAASQPDNGLILDRLGQAYRALDRLDDSIRTLRKASQLAPDEPVIVLHLANALAEAGKEAESGALMGRYRQMRPTQAPRDLMRYLSLTPEQQRADYRARVEKAVHDNPGDPNAQLHYLELSLEERQTGQALATARVIAALKPNPAILVDAGRALLEARQYAISREFLEKALAANPSAGVELPLAIAAFQSTGANDGLHQMERVPEPARHADYYLALAQMLDAAGNSAEAIAAVDHALEIAPDSIAIYWQKVVFLKKSGHVEDALNLLDRAAKTLPREPAIPALRAALLESGGRVEEAQRLLEDARRRWPEVPVVWVAEGLIRAAHGSPERARRALETALSLGAHSPEAASCLSALKAGSPPNQTALFFTRPPQDW